MKCILFLIPLSLQVAWAKSVDETFQQTVKEFKTRNETIADTAMQYQWQEVLPKVEDNSVPIDGYQGETQTQEALSEKGMISLAQNDALVSVLNAFSTRPLVRINPESKEMKTGEALEVNAAAVMEGAIPVDQCTVSSKDITCERPVRTLTYTCLQTPKVTIKTQEHSFEKILTGNIAARSHSIGTFSVPLKGVVTSFSVVLKSNNQWLCNRTYQSTLNGVKVGSDWHACGHYLGDLSFKNETLSIPVEANQTLNFKLLGTAYGAWTRATYHVRLHITETQKTVDMIWQEDCR